MIATGLYNTLIGIDVEQTSIDQVKTEFSGKTLFLNVFLNQPRTCKEVIDELGLERIPVDTTLYLPTCVIVKDNYIKIRFEEKPMI